MLATSLSAYKGARGDAATDCTAALARALAAVIRAGGGCLTIPPGTWQVRGPVLPPGPLAVPLALRGSGGGVSRLQFAETSGLGFLFAQTGYQQPHGLELADLGLLALGPCGPALRVGYGSPDVTNDHYRPALALRGVRVESSDAGHWAEGIEIADAWNATVENVFISGSPAGGDWARLAGTGLRFTGLCANAHLANVRCNFWATGLAAHAVTGPNTEGLFASNCSMVAVQRGVWIAGNRAAPAPRISTLTWTGGLVECRVGGLAYPAVSAAFHLQDVWTALITGTQCIAETLPPDHPTVALLAEDSAGLVVSACDLNAFHRGVETRGACHAVNSHGNTFTNVARQHHFGSATTGSRSAGHVYFNNAPHDLDLNGGNRLAG